MKFEMLKPSLKTQLIQIFIFTFLFISIDRLNCNIYLKKEITK